jgi:hypothetical protein
MRIDSGRTDAAHKPLTVIEEQSWRSGISGEMAGVFPYMFTEVLKAACSGQVVACFFHPSICDRYWEKWPYPSPEWISLAIEFIVIFAGREGDWPLAGMQGHCCVFVPNRQTRLELIP